MPPLQDLALHLFDAKKTRFEVFFHLFIYNGLGFTGTQGFHPSEIWASFIPMLYITTLPSKMSFGCTLFFFKTLGVSLSWAWSHTRDILFGVQALLSFVRQVSATIVLLSKHVFSLAALLRITRASCECHLYKRR